MAQPIPLGSAFLESYSPYGFGTKKYKKVQKSTRSAESVFGPVAQVLDVAR